MSLSVWGTFFYHFHSYSSLSICKQKSRCTRSTCHLYQITMLSVMSSPALSSFELCDWCQWKLSCQRTTHCYICWFCTVCWNCKQKVWYVWPVNRLSCRHVGGKRDITLLAVNLSCRWRGVVSLTLWPLYFQGDTLWNYNKNCNCIKGTWKSKISSPWSFRSSLPGSLKRK